MVSGSVVGERFLLLAEGLSKVGLEEGDARGEVKEEGVGSGEADEFGEELSGRADRRSAQENGDVLNSEEQLEGRLSLTFSASTKSDRTMHTPSASHRSSASSISLWAVHS
jgi:hypothetical protein